MSEQLCLRITNSLPELDQVRSEVERFLECSAIGGREAYQIQLALDELITNVILYAYENQGGHFIDLSLVHCPGFVEAVLQDDGKPFNPLLVPEPDVCAPVDSRKPGGLGIHFVKKTMDELAYKRKDGKNILHMRKNTS